MPRKPAKLSNEKTPYSSFYRVAGWLFHRPGEGGTWVNFCWVCAAGLTDPLPQYSLFLVWVIDQVCSVKMAGYWPSSFFACLWTEICTWIFMYLDINMYLDNYS